MWIAAAKSAAPQQELAFKLGSRKPIRAKILAGSYRTDGPIQFPGLWIVVQRQHNGRDIAAKLPVLHVYKLHCLAGRF